MIKNRRLADKRRLMFWFNVSVSRAPYHLILIPFLPGGTWLFILRRSHDGGRSMENGWEGGLEHH